MADGLEGSIEACGASALTIAILTDGTLKYLWALINSA